MLPQLVVEGEKNNKGRAYLLQPCPISKSKKKKLHPKNYSIPIIFTDEEEFEFPSENDCQVDDSMKNVVIKKNQKKTLKSKFIKFIVDSLININDNDKLTPPEKKE